MLASTLLTLLHNLHILIAAIVLSTVNFVIEKGLANQLVKTSRARYLP